MNPADECSRGLNPKDFLTDSVWLTGPKFLSGPESERPAQPTLEEPRQHDPEVKPDAWVGLVTVAQCDVLQRLTARLSSLQTIKKGRGMGPPVREECQGET